MLIACAQTGDAEKNQPENELFEVQQCLGWKIYASANLPKNAYFHLLGHESTTHTGHVFQPVISELQRKYVSEVSTLQ